MKKDWILIQNIKTFVDNSKLKLYHPDDPRHTPYWREEKKKCIEGIWRKDFGKYRYMPGRLYFYGHYCIIEHTNEEDKTRSYAKPYVQDIEWERTYMMLEAEGFSGFSDDNEYTCDENHKKLAKNYPNIDTSKKRNMAMINSEGMLKKYIEPREYMRKLHDKPLGQCYYWNNTKNIMELGGRGGGKSYFWSLAGALYRIVFDGARYYTEKSRKKPTKASVLVGSGQVGKSSDFCDKIETAMNALAIRDDLGVWGEIGDEAYTPSILYKEMTGTLNPNNKKNKWKHSYSQQVGNQWYHGLGSASNVSHVSFSSQKKTGAEEGAGGRYNDIYYEEVGLTSEVINAYNSNRATVVTGSLHFGVQVFMGTSGNMESILPTKKMFTNPNDYDILSFDDDYESGITKIAFFLPNYITNRDFKDTNGNTDVEGAIDYYKKAEMKAAESSDPSILRVQKMNHPSVPSDMWQTEGGNILPVAEAEARVKVLQKDGLYDKLGIKIKLRWDSTQTTGITYDIDHDAEPFYEFPLETKSNRMSLEGSINIFEMPCLLHGFIPNDMYIFTHDPYVSDEWELGGSLGVTHVWMNPKYWDKYLVNSPLVATYIGKAQNGKKGYYENLEKLLAFYGNPLRGLWYEANRGEFCRGWFQKKRKMEVLSLRPQYEKGDNVYQKQITQYGFIVGNKIAKIAMLDDFSDFLLQDVIIRGEKKKVIETLPCIFSVRQIAMYSLDGNFDAVSSMMGFPLFIREEEHNALNDLKNKIGKKNPLGFLMQNKHLYRQSNRR